MPLLASVKNLLHWAWWELWTEGRGWLNSSQTGWNSPWSNSSAFKWQEKKNQQKSKEIGQNITLDISNISSYFIYNTVIVYYWTCEAMWFDVGTLLSKCLRECVEGDILNVVIQWSSTSTSEGAHPSHLIAGVSTQTWRWTDLWAHASCELMKLGVTVPVVISAPLPSLWRRRSWPRPSPCRRLRKDFAVKWRTWRFTLSYFDTLHYM